MTRIGVFGGSFNPIHEGHLNFLKQMKTCLNLDKIILLICDLAEHKNVNLMSKIHRLKMCDMATKTLNFIEISDLKFEIKKNGSSILALQQIKQHNKNAELFLIVGPDAFLNIGRWHRLDKILKLAKIASAYSNNYEHDEMHRLDVVYKTNAVLLKLKLICCHSTMIRIKFAQGFLCDELLNSNVAQYIKKNKLLCGKGLFEQECENVCKNMVSPKRFSHCVLVAKMARFLAKTYGEDEKSAHVAGILHDVVKEQNLNYLRYILRLGEKKLKKTNDVNELNPKLWHAPAGAIYCKHILGIENKKIFSAIECHTTAKANMTTLDKIIYISDNTSADRKSTTAKIVRKIALSSLDGAVFFYLKHYIKLCCDKQILIPLSSVECYNQLALNEEQN